MKLLRFAVISFSLALMAGTVWGQTCTLKTQGYTGGCSNVNVLWFTQTPQSSISHFNLNTFAGGFTASNTARSYSIPTSCSSGGQVVITEVRTDRTSCTVQYSGNLPHNRPCDQCAGVGGGLSTRNAATFGPFLAPDAIGAAFGDSDFTTVTAASYDADPQTPGYQLPQELGGVRLLIDGQPVGLFFVSPKQINFHVPASLSLGLHSVQAVTPDGRALYGDVFLAKNNPGIFTQEANGNGQATYYWWIFRNGIPFRILTPGQLRRTDVQFGDRVFAILFGTGINSPRAELRLSNGRVFNSLYAGDSPLFVGLDQLNFEIAQDELWDGSIGASLTVFDDVGASWPSNGFTLLGFTPR